eukprot:c5700_g1_i1.p1 GENE.c5700_g1_i1~~c5700_g1_i1.p1  ORF type:complete len:387 (-),score=94.34 c5700_g1_i1:46-1206(-)
MDHRFWKTQPVPQSAEDLKNLGLDQIGPIEVKNVEDIRTTPYQLPDGFLWSDVNINNEAELSELYQFLNANYVEDSDAMFRFDYSKEFLRWALQPPHMRPEYLIGVRLATNSKLFGFISAIPATLDIYHSPRPLVEINFLCVHKKLREKRLAPVLIREVTRRCNINGIFQAVYTGGSVVPTPVVGCRYYHRNLNTKKLVEIRFTSLNQRQTLARAIKLYRLPETPRVPLEPLTEADTEEAMALVMNYLQKFQLHPVFTREEFAHWFLPRQDVISSYVVKTNGKITDLVSFYTLPSTVLHHPQHNSIKVAYSYYNVATTVTLPELMGDALVLANNSQHDVFNALDLMENRTFFEPLKFAQGDGELHYYLYNWKIPSLQNGENGIILL